MSKKLISEWLPAENLNGLNSSIPSKYPSGTLWPHGEFSYGWASERDSGPPERRDAWYVRDSALEPFHTPDLAAWLPLDLSAPANSHKAKRRGLNGITGHGQQMIKACGYMLQEKYPRHRKTLGTVTLPPMSQQTRREVVEMWPELTRQLLQWLGRRLQQSGLPPIICSVTEVQPKRLAAQNEGCLHWHVLWLNHPGRFGNWAVEPNDVRAWLCDLLQRKIPSYQGGYINIDTRRVEGKVAGYLAKYMSKGKQMIAEALEDWGEDNCPRTWYNLTAPARAMVKAATKKGREIGLVLVECVEHGKRIGLDEVFAFVRPVVIEFDNSSILIGWRGRFHPGVHRLLLGVINCD